MKSHRDTKRLFTRLLTLGATLFVFAHAAIAREKPNFVVVFIDDMGYGDIGPFGNTVNQTPNLDRMAAEGNVLRQFYVANTACTPSRSALMTGTYAHRIGKDVLDILLGKPGAKSPHELHCYEVDAIRRGPWKLLRFPHPRGKIELYNLDEDIGERNDLATKHPDLVAELSELLTAHAKRIAGQNYTLDTRPVDTHATFRVKLPVGKTQLATTFMDGNDRALCSAIYVYLKPVTDGGAAEVK